MNTTIAVFVALNMQVRRENRAELITLPLLHLTPLLIWGWKVSRFLGSWGHLQSKINQGFQNVKDLAHALTVTVTVINIGLRSILYGLGVSL
jgi:hypothetical protein